jgi:hypothetical protein
MPRGIRNNNPGNIERGQASWRGMAPDQSPDPRFVVFASPEFGIRALAKILLNYQRKHGIRTIDGIIRRYAPPGENDAGAYARAVAAACGVDPMERIDIAQRLPDIVPAIIRHENGRQPYSDDLIARGIAMAAEG